MELRKYTDSSFAFCVLPPLVLVLRWDNGALRKFPLCLFDLRHRIYLSPPTRS